MAQPQLTRAGIAADLAALGLRPGGAVMVHAALSKVGSVLGRPDAVIAALMDTVGPQGTVLAYADWHVDYDDLLDAGGRVPAEWRDHIPAFDPATARATKHNGVFPEFLRTTPGARRSGNPGASVVALGAKAGYFTADHPMDYGYGPGTPFARLVEASGKVLMLGAPLDTMTLLHHAEHVAEMPGKRVKRWEVPILEAGVRTWHVIEEFDTADPVVDSLSADHFDRIVSDYMATGRGTRGLVGRADSVLFDAASMTEFAVAWLERAATTGSKVAPSCE